MLNNDIFAIHGLHNKVYVAEVDYNLFLKAIYTL